MNNWSMPMGTVMPSPLPAQSLISEKVMEMTREQEEDEKVG